jgi:hypothetical protein
MWIKGEGYDAGGGQKCLVTNGARSLGAGNKITAQQKRSSSSSNSNTANLITAGRIDAVVDDRKQRYDETAV